MIWYPHQRKNEQVCSGPIHWCATWRSAGSPRQCLHSCQAAVHAQTLAYNTVRCWKSADTKKTKESAETHVPTSGKQLKYVSRVICVVRPLHDAHTELMPYKGSWQKHQASTSSSDQIKVGLPLMLLLCQSAGYFHKHSCPSLVPGLRSQWVKQKKIYSDMLRCQSFGFGESFTVLFSF